MHEHTTGVRKTQTGQHRRVDVLVALKAKLCMSVIFTLLQDCENEMTQLREFRIFGAVLRLSLLILVGTTSTASPRHRNPNGITSLSPGLACALRATLGKRPQKRSSLSSAAEERGWGRGGSVSISAQLALISGFRSQT